MVENPSLVLYGNSVFLAGIKAELERATTLELLTIESGRQDALELTCRRQPRAVLFDLGTGPLDFVVSLLRGQPGVLLIGVDPSSNEMLVVWSRSTQARNMHDLVQLILEDSSTQPKRIGDILRERIGDE